MSKAGREERIYLKRQDWDQLNNIYTLCKTKLVRTAILEHLRILNIPIYRNTYSGGDYDEYPHLMVKWKKVLGYRNPGFNTNLKEVSNENFIKMFERYPSYLMTGEIYKIYPIIKAVMKI